MHFDKYHFCKKNIKNGEKPNKRVVQKSEKLTMTGIFAIKRPTVRLHHGP